MTPYEKLEVLVKEYYQFYRLNSKALAGELLRDIEIIIPSVMHKIELEDRAEQCRQDADRQQHSRRSNDH
jgi:hypothetical protein